MDTPTPPGEEDNLPVLLTPEQDVLDIIRAETVLSKLPVHNLTKKAHVKIQISRLTPTGTVELRWEVSYSNLYGPARQLAYKIDTLIINDYLEKAGKPLPKIIRLGTLNNICAELGLAINHGTNNKNVKRAIMQNVGTVINARLNYKANDGSERFFEAVFTRYHAVFKGEELPNGRKADAVYIVLNDPFWEVLNNAPVRPLDRAYMKELPPAAQRFYEIISYRLFAAIKHKRPYAKLAYSEFCTLSAACTRSSDWNFVRAQMLVVHEPHLKSGYILKPIEHEKALDEEGNPDWIFLYRPGPRAHAEYAVHNPRYRVPKMIDAKPANPSAKRQKAPVEKPASPPPPSPQPVITQHGGVDDAILIAEIGKRGIGETEARQILARCPADQPVLDQLEHADLTVHHPKSKIQNPPGFYRYRLEQNFALPSSYETRAMRQAREEAEERAREAAREMQMFEGRYMEYTHTEFEQYIASLPPAEFEPRVAEQVKRLRKQPSLQHVPANIVRSYALAHLRPEVLEEIPGLLSFEEFCARERRKGKSPTQS